MALTYIFFLSSWVSITSKIKIKIDTLIGTLGVMLGINRLRIYLTVVILPDTHRDELITRFGISNIFYPRQELYSVFLVLESLELKQVPFIIFSFCQLRTSLCNRVYKTRPFCS